MHGITDEISMQSGRPFSNAMHPSAAYCVRGSVKTGAFVAGADFFL